jgi:hypothetical protein
MLEANIGNGGTPSKVNCFDPVRSMNSNVRHGPIRNVLAVA